MVAQSVNYIISQGKLFSFSLYVNWKSGFDVHRIFCYENFTLGGIMKSEIFKLIENFVFAAWWMLSNVCLTVQLGLKKSEEDSSYCWSLKKVWSEFVLVS